MSKKADGLISEAEVLAILTEAKETVRPLEWDQKNGSLPAPWWSYKTACKIRSEVREDVMFVAQYREARKIVDGMAEINLDQQFNAAILVGPHRIIALDTTTTPHTNKIGVGLPFYRKQLTCRTHLHIWTPEGYGYAEPIVPEHEEFDDLVHDFVQRTNLVILGGFDHPLRWVQRDLL